MAPVLPPYRVCLIALVLAVAACSAPAAVTGLWDSEPPSCWITYPEYQHGPYDTVTHLAGGAWDYAGSGVGAVYVYLQKVSGGVVYYWYWWDRVWSTVDDPLKTFLIASGTTDWQVAGEYLPSWTPYTENNTVYRVSAWCNDRAGNKSLTTVQTFYINPGDTTPPNVTITSPAANQVTWRLQEIRGTASDDRTGVSFVLCQLRNRENRFWNWDSGTWTTVGDEAGVWKQADGSTSWSITTGLPSLPCGPYYLTAYAEDGVGNGAVSPEVFFCIRDFTPPTVAITYPSDGGSYWPGPTAFTGTAADDESGVEGIECVLWRSTDAGTKYWNWTNHVWQTLETVSTRTTAIGTTDWTVTQNLPAPWPLGEPLTLQATARNASGWGAIATSVFTVGENGAPTGQIVSPAEGQDYYPGPTAISGTASDAGSGVQSVQCYLGWQDGAVTKYWNWTTGTWVASLEGACWAAATGTTEWQVSAGLPNPWPCCQSYVAGAKITDANGNATDLTSSFRVGDWTAPVITSVTASRSTLPTNGKLFTVTITVYATDVDPALTTKVTGVTCNEVVKGPEAGSKADWLITGPLTVKLRGVTAGRTPRVYTVYVSCTDHCGNAATGSVDVTVPVKRK